MSESPSSTNGVPELTTDELLGTNEANEDFKILSNDPTDQKETKKSSAIPFDISLFKSETLLSDGPPEDRIWNFFLENIAPMKKLSEEPELQGINIHSTDPKDLRIIEDVELRKTAELLNRIKIWLQSLYPKGLGLFDLAHKLQRVTDKEDFMDYRIELLKKYKKDDWRHLTPENNPPLISTATPVDSATLQSVEEKRRQILLRRQKRLSTIQEGAENNSNESEQKKRGPEESSLSSWNQDFEMGHSESANLDENEKLFLDEIEMDEVYSQSHSSASVSSKKFAESKFFEKDNRRQSTSPSKSNSEQENEPPSVLNQSEEQPQIVDKVTLDAIEAKRQAILHRRLVNKNLAAKSRSSLS